MLGKNYLQVSAAYQNSHKNADEDKMSTVAYMEEREDSGLGSIGPSSFDHSGIFVSGPKLEHGHTEVKPKIDNSLKLHKEDYLTQQLDSGIGYSLCDLQSLTSETSSQITSVTNSISQLELEDSHESEKDNFHRNHNVTRPYSEDIHSHISFSISMNQRVQLFEGDKDGDNKLHLSILSCDQVWSSLLIKLAPHHNWLNYSNHLRQTPLHLAVLTNQAQIVRQLICAGADATYQDKDGNTPLHIACRQGSEDIVKCLLKPVQNGELSENLFEIPKSRLTQVLSIRNYEGETCLHIAVRHSHILLTNLLLAFGADVNVGDGKSGRTALHIASELNHVDIIKLILVRREANINVRNYAGLTPVQLAFGRGHKDSVNEICRHVKYTKAEMSLFDSSDDDEDMLTDSD